jgi:hypothetical protein
MCQHNRRELRSLLSLQSKLPALPEFHPFIKATGIRVELIVLNVRYPTDWRQY